MERGERENGREKERFCYYETTEKVLSSLVQWFNIRTRTGQKRVNSVTQMVKVNW